MVPLFDPHCSLKKVLNFCFSSFFTTLQEKGPEIFVLDNQPGNNPIQLIINTCNQCYLQLDLTVFTRNLKLVVTKKIEILEILPIFVKKKLRIWYLGHGHDLNNGLYRGS